MPVVLRYGHDDAVAGTYDMQQEISVGMKGLAPQRSRNGKRAAVNDCPCGRSRERRHMTIGTTNLDK